jgi:hypothetical protein
VLAGHVEDCAHAVFCERHAANLFDEGLRQAAAQEAEHVAGLLHLPLGPGNRKQLQKRGAEEQECGYGASLVCRSDGMV